ncbi:hypothetical protein BY458DRAFT_528253 [Sporodiniella umbellata]|nr:hypothetical protein BY458DRAFT_528253 [Sporodiniella umbellata]
MSSPIRQTSHINTQGPSVPTHGQPLDQTSHRMEDNDTTKTLASTPTSGRSASSSQKLKADSNAFFEPHHFEDVKLSPGERAKKLGKEMESANFEERRRSLGNADKLLNIGKSKDVKIQ